MKPTYEELEAKVALLEPKLELLSDLLEKALKKIQQLETKLSKNSRNSSKPPSSDQKANSDDKPRKTRKSRKGRSREQVSPEKVDREIDCTMDLCPHCKSDLLLQLGKLLFQQEDVPPTQSIITQYNRHQYCCQNCQKHCTAPLPKGVDNSAFGPNITAMVAYLTGVRHLSKRDAITLLNEFYGVRMGLGSVPNLEEKMAKALLEPYNKIHKHVMESIFSKHWDETTWRNCGKRHYAWVAATKYAAFFSISRQRSQAAFLEISQQQNLNAVVVTDRYCVYNILQQKRQYCLAHLIRDFEAYSEAGGPGSKEAESIKIAMIDLCQTQKKHREKEISLRSRNARYRFQNRKLEDALVDGMTSTNQTLGDLCMRLWEEFDRLVTFTKYTDVDPTNNLAERDLRRLVLWRKKSYGTRSDRGKRFVERITTIAETLRRKGKHTLDYLIEALKSLQWDIPAPLIELPA